MKKVIIISIIIGIIITGSVILLNSNQEVEEAVRETLGETVEDRWEREQITSGPFSIDKSQYNLGEKIFITVTNLPQDEKGQMIFFRPMQIVLMVGKSTSQLIMMDNNKDQFNLYFEPHAFRNEKDMLRQMKLQVHGL